MKLLKFSALSLLLFAATAFAPQTVLAQSTIEVTHTQSIAIDQNSSGTVNPGDTLLYTSGIENTDEVSVFNVVVTITPDPNVQVVPGSLNVRPLAVDDNVTVTENTVTPAVLNLFTNDAGLDPGETLQVTTLGGSTTPGTQATTFGTITWSADGTVSYQVNIANPTVNALGNGGTLFDMISYTFGDGSGFTDSAIIEVAITGIEDAPIVTSDSFDVFNNHPTSVNAANGVLANDSDPEMGTLTVSAFTPTSTNGATVSVAADGSFTYTPMSMTTGSTDTFMYTAMDINGQTTSGTVTVTGFGRLFVVDNTAGPSGSGTIADPFDDLADAFGANQAKDTIYLRVGDGMSTGQNGNYTFGAENMQLLGEGVALILNNTTVIPAGANKPVVGALGVPTFAVTNFNLTLRGLDIQCQGSGATALNASYTIGTRSLMVSDIDMGTCDGGFEISVVDTAMNPSTNVSMSFTKIEAPSANGSVVDIAMEDSSVGAVTVTDALLTGSSRALALSTIENSSLTVTAQNLVANMMSGVLAFQATASGTSTMVLNFNSGNQFNNSSTGISLLESGSASITLNMVPGGAPANSISGNTIGICNDSSLATLNIVPAGQLNANMTNIETMGCT